MKPIYIYDAIRTPRGKAKDNGGLHDLRPHDLLKCLYHSLQQRTGLNPEQVGEVVLGCVTQSGDQADALALQSQQRAEVARCEGYFKSIVPIHNPVKDITVAEDECIRAQTTMESLARLSPAFAELGQQRLGIVAASALLIEQL